MSQSAVALYAMQKAIQKLLFAQQQQQQQHAAISIA
jgi:hypothetical protein